MAYTAAGIIVGEGSMGRFPALVRYGSKLVLEIMLAAYASAREGRKTSLPFRPQGVRRPIDLWRPPGER